MFNPIDFYKFAKTLNECEKLESEACDRTIIGRCYYSSFLSSKQFAIELGSIELLEYDKPYFKRKGEIHSAVRDSLFEHHLGHIANFLKDLFDRRVDADYYPNKSINKKDAGEAIALCEMISEKIKEFK